MQETTIIGFFIGGMGFILTVIDKNKGGTEQKDLKED
jgi:hypothetical protein